MLWRIASSIVNPVSVNRAETEGETKKSRAEPDATPNGFTEFWSTYPRKAAKPEAIKAWKKVKEDEIQTILRDIEFRKTSTDWTKDDGHFVPHPATYLNQRRWEDETVKDKSKEGNVQKIADKQAELEALKQREWGKRHEKANSSIPNPAYRVHFRADPV